jgi:hypothetical protein
MKTLYKITPIAIALFFCSFLFLLAGCGTTSPQGKLSTPSGRPEVTIPNSNIQTVMDNVAAWLASQGKPILGTGVYTISALFTKQNSLLGITYKSNYTTVYTIVQNGANVSLYGVVVNEQNNNEQTEQSDYEDMQKELIQIADFIKTRSSTEVTK